MFVSSMDTCSHFHNNDHTKQKSYPTIVLNPIYRCSKKTHVPKNKPFIYVSNYT